MHVLSFLSLLALAQAPTPERPFALMVGDPAPPLAVSSWLRGAPCARFEPGRAYVVEFWATWCKPCVRSIPHLSELQRRFEGRVDVLGIDVWEADFAAAAPFVEGMGERMAYSVAVDDAPAPPPGDDDAIRWSSEHGKTSLAWLHASGWSARGIPVAFLVDGGGRVAWIGEPLELDAPLATLLEGRLDLARESEAYRARVGRWALARPIEERLANAQRRRDHEGVVRCVDELLALDPAEHAHLAGSKFQTLLCDLRRPEDAYAFAREALEGVARDSAAALGQIAYVIAYMAEDPLEEELALARDAALRADELAKGTRPGVLDALARVHFLTGEPQRAVEVQRRALEAAFDERERRELEERLREYERATD